MTSRRQELHRRPVPPQESITLAPKNQGRRSNPRLTQPRARAWMTHRSSVPAERGRGGARFAECVLVDLDLVCQTRYVRTNLQPETGRSPAIRLQSACAPESPAAGRTPCRATFSVGAGCASTPGHYLRWRTIRHHQSLNPLWEEARHSPGNTSTPVVTYHDCTFTSERINHRRDVGTQGSMSYGPRRVVWP